MGLGEMTSIVRLFYLKWYVPVGTIISVHNYTWQLLEGGLYLKMGFISFVAAIMWRRRQQRWTIPLSCWVGTPKTTYNSWTTHGKATKPGWRTPVRNLEDHGCKPPVAKLASVLHTCLWAPQLCSLCINEIHCDCHMISYRDTIGPRLVAHSLSFIATFEHMMSDVF